MTTPADMEISFKLPVVNIVPSASGKTIFLLFVGPTIDKVVVAELDTPPSINRNIFLPDASGTIITTGNLEDINGQVQSLSVKDELSINGNVTLGDSREDDILLGGIVQNFNSPIVKGIAIYNDFVKVTVMEHTLKKDMKVLIYSVESISLHNTNTINNIYMVDRVTKCTVSSNGYNWII